jgi:hypothetical protein
MAGDGLFRRPYSGRQSKLGPLKKLGHTLGDEDAAKLRRYLGWLFHFHADVEDWPKVAAMRHISNCFHTMEYMLDNTGARIPRITTKRGRKLRRKDPSPGQLKLGF